MGKIQALRVRAKEFTLTPVNDCSPHPESDEADRP